MSTYLDANEPLTKQQRTRVAPAQRRRLPNLCALALGLSALGIGAVAAAQVTPPLSGTFHGTLRADKNSDALVIATFRGPPDAIEGTFNLTAGARVVGCYADEVDVPAGQLIMSGNRTGTTRSGARYVFESDAVDLNTFTATAVTNPEAQLSQSGLILTMPVEVTVTHPLLGDCDPRTWTFELERTGRVFGESRDDSTLAAACSKPEQCSSGYCDIGDGSAKTGLCMPNRDGRPGEACTDAKQCASLLCSDLKMEREVWMPGRCEAPRALGGPCSVHAQCVSGYCDAGTGTSHTNLCMPNQNGQPGDLCSHDNQCTSLVCAGLHAVGNAWVPGKCADKQGLSSSCSQHYQCASGYCDAGNGSSKTNLCMPNKNGQLGDACSNDNQCSSSICAGLHAVGNTWVPGKCADKQGLSSSCSQHYQCASGYCDAGNGSSKTNLCMPNNNGQLGDACSNDNQCTSLVCAGLHAVGNAWVPGKCADKQGLSSSCSQHYQCASGYCDAGNGSSKTNLCMPNKNGQLGDACSNDNQCGSSICAGLHAVGNSWVPGKCADKQSLSGPCTQHYQCASGYCDAGNNSSRTNLCMPNKDGKPGDPCSHPDQCASHGCSVYAQGNVWIPGTCS